MSFSAKDGGICWSPKWHVRMTGDCGQPGGAPRDRPPNLIQNLCEPQRPLRLKCI